MNFYKPNRKSYHWGVLDFTDMCENMNLYLMHDFLQSKGDPFRHTELLSKWNSEQYIDGVSWSGCREHRSGSPKLLPHNLDSLLHFHTHAHLLTLHMGLKTMPGNHLWGFLTLKSPASYENLHIRNCILK